MVGNIAIAVETGNGWERNDAVYTIPNFLGFEGSALALNESLGSVDVDSVPIEKTIQRQNVNQFVNGMGTFTVTYLDHLLPIAAERTNVVLVVNSELLNTAQMSVTFAYRTDDEIRTFSTVGYHLTYDDDEPAPYLEWNPPLGEMQARVGFMWASSGALNNQEARRKFADDVNFIFRMVGFTEIQGSGGVTSIVDRGGVIDLPTAHFASVEDSY